MVWWLLELHKTLLYEDCKLAITTDMDRDMWLTGTANSSLWLFNESRACCPGTIEAVVVQVMVREEKNAIKLPNFFKLRDRTTVYY